MLCYVGKATKIFVFIIFVLAIVGLLLGFGVFRHGLQKSHKCEEHGCQHGYSDPIPVPAVPSTPFMEASPPPYKPPSPVIAAPGPENA